jgi:hypothetical protein
MSTSLMDVPGSTVLRWELLFGSMNKGHHRATFKHGNGPSYRTHISAYPFVTPKKVVSDFTKTTSKYLRFNTLSSFALTGALRKVFFSALCGSLYECAKFGSNHRGVPSCICIMNSGVQIQKKGVEHTSQFQQDQSLIRFTQSFPISTSWLPAHGGPCNQVK